MSWDVESKQVKVRPGAVIDPYANEPEPDRGDRYRYRCNLCRHAGPWRKNGNDANGDDHLYRKHGMGE